MAPARYDKSSVQSIYEFALKLVGKSLSQVVELPKGVENNKNRGDLGSLIERYFFEHQPPNDHRPDFAEAGLELKTTGVKKSGKEFKAKERLVLTMINYESVVNENWQNSTFLNKCKKMLILCYLYDKEIPAQDRIFPLNPILYEIPESDLSIIKSDWELIKKKVIDGKAHELSEGDTFYLAACRKGSGGEKEALQRQPFSPIKAKSRAFSFKPSYLNVIIKSASQSQPQKTNVITSDFDAELLECFSPYINKSIEEISRDLVYFKKSRNHKGFNKDLVNRIITKRIGLTENLGKAGVEVKTIRLNSKGIPREAMSFPGFDFFDILDEAWEDSSFYRKLEMKFLFVVFRDDELGVERLNKVSYWNMPFQDREEAWRVWEDTKRRVKVDATNLPSAKESNVAHVRPKARNGNDLALTPQGTKHLKQCFWLNKDYINKVVKSL